MKVVRLKTQLFECLFPRLLWCVWTLKWLIGHLIDHVTYFLTYLLTCVILLTSRDLLLLMNRVIMHCVSKKTSKVIFVVTTSNFHQIWQFLARRYQTVWNCMMCTHFIPHQIHVNALSWKFDVVITKIILLVFWDTVYNYSVIFDTATMHAVHVVCLSVVCLWQDGVKSRAVRIVDIVQELSVPVRRDITDHDVSKVY